MNTPAPEAPKEPNRPAVNADDSRPAKRLKPLSNRANLVTLIYCIGVLGVNVSKWSLSVNVLARTFGELFIFIGLAVIYNGTRGTSKAFEYLMIGLVLFEFLYRLNRF